MPTIAQILLKSLFFFVFFGCVKKQEPKAIATKEVPPVLVESEMLVKVNECRVCHGTQEAQRGPILDGMEYWYLYEQLQKFHSGVRGQNPKNRSEYLMGVGARKIDNQVEIAYLADWFAKQDPKPAIRTIQGDKNLGKKLYEQRCVQCHGDRAEGNRKLKSPALDKLEGWYFIEQMRKFRSGDRGYHPKDEWGRVMATASKDLADWDLKNLIAFVVEEFGLPEAQPINGNPVPGGSRKPF
jgi:cytochrome c oxidase subunit 2